MTKNTTSGKAWQGANAPTYFASSLVTEKKSFMTLTRGHRQQNGQVERLSGSAHFWRKCRFERRQTGSNDHRQTVLQAAVVDRRAFADL
jgi:hypothetical protein